MLNVKKIIIGFILYLVMLPVFVFASPETGLRDIEALRLNYQNELDEEQKLINFCLLEDAVINLYIAKRYNEAEQQLEFLLAEDADNWGVFQILIETLLLQEKYDKAIELCRQYLADDPSNSYIHLCLCHIYIETEEYQMVEKHAQLVLLIEPDNYDASMYMAKSLIAGEKPLQAVYYLSKAQNLKPEQLSSYIKLGRIYFEANQNIAAVEQVEKAMQINYWNIKLLKLAADVYQQSGEYEKAKSVLQEALKLDPGQDDLNMQLARIYLDEEKYLKASRVLENISNDPDYVYEKNIMLAFSYGAMSKVKQLRTVLKEYPIVFLSMAGSVIMLFCICLTVIGSLFLAAFWLGKKSRHRSMRFRNIQWSLPQAFYVCIVLFTLPFFLEIFFGGIIFKNWFLFLSPSKMIETAAGQNSLFSQLLTVVLSGVMVFWLVICRNKQSIRDLGFRWVGVKKTFIIVIKSVAAIFVFNACYMTLFSMLSGVLPEQQYIGEIISHASDFRHIAVLFFMAVIIGPLAEEIIFRGFIYSGLRRKSGFLTASIISACIFSIFHMHPGLFIPLAFMGFIFARIYEKSNSILPCVIVHMLWNFISFSSLIF